MIIADSLLQSLYSILNCPFGHLGETHIFMIDSCVKVNIILFNLMKFRYNAFLVVL